MRLSIKILCCCLLISQSVMTQNVLNGKVIDAKTKEPLAFVNIVYGDRQGVTTSIDGLFSIPVNGTIHLKVSFIGYQQQDIVVTLQDTKHFKLIYLQPEAYQLAEVKVLPGINPADVIMEHVIDNRKIHDPEKHLDAFSYLSYNKMYFTAKTPNNKSLQKDTISVKLDSANIQKSDTIQQSNQDTSKMTKFLNKRHLLMMESISRRFFKAPDKSTEEVIASKVSGFAMPTFVILATQLQSFSFYKSQLNLMDKHYLSPVSKGSPQSYFFMIKDTTYIDGDTIFIISFQPHKNKNFNGLKGIIYINATDYAIQNVIAQPIEQGNFFIKIQQKYQKVDSQWMPTQLNSDIIFNNLIVADSGQSGVSLIGVNKTYFSDIKINPILDSINFTGVALKVDKKAFKQPDSLWQKVRTIPLNSKEIETYRFIDSLGQAEHFDTKYRLFKFLSNGKIPIWFINWDVLKIIQFNQYEEFRPQLALETNDKVADWFTLGGYGAYGSRDKAWKYGGKLSFQFLKVYQLGLNLEYRYDVAETGGLKFYNDKPKFISTEYYRDMMINNMFSETVYHTDFTFRTLRYLIGNIFAQYRTTSSNDNYRYNTVSDNISISIPQISTNEVGLQLRYAYKEKQAQMIDEFFGLGTKYPILFLNYTKGILYKDKGILYNKIELQISKHIFWKKIGETNIKFTGGLVDGEVPLWLQFNGNASYYRFTVEAANTFATMRMNEFFSDRFVAFYFEHDFKDLLIKTRYFSPGFKVVYHGQFGTMNNTTQHNTLNFNTLEKGYHETGLVINNLLRSNMSGVGIGVFYRFGPYRFENYKDNLAFKLSLSFNFD